MEVLVAMTILVFSMAGAYKAVTMAMQARGNAHNFYTATVLANNRIERAKSLTFGDLAMLAEENRAVNAQGALDADGRYRRTTTITIDEAGENEEPVSRVEVVVQAPALRGGQAGGGPSVLVSTLLINENP